MNRDAAVHEYDHKQFRFDRTATGRPTHAHRITQRDSGEGRAESRSAHRSRAHPLDNHTRRPSGSDKYARCITALTSGSTLRSRRRRRSRKPADRQQSMRGNSDPSRTSHLADDRTLPARTDSTRTRIYIAGYRAARFPAVARTDGSEGETVGESSEYSRRGGPRSLAHLAKLVGLSGQ